MASVNFEISSTSSSGPPTQQRPRQRLMMKLKEFPEKLWENGVVEVAKIAKKMGEDDPRRIIHSVKMVSTLTLVSLFYYLQPLYDVFGEEAIWAVLTVVLVFEFSVGATMGKGLNRMTATLLGGALGVAAKYLATLFGGIGKPIFLAASVFIVVAIVTFMRFHPALKARYDYGLMIFILTFSLVTVSSYRDDEVLEIAYKRLLTIVIGSCICVAVCICICPVWIGADLHNSVAKNLEMIGDFLQGFGGEYFGRVVEDGDDKSFLEGYKSVLNSKSTQETMANLARWEPFHGKFRFRHPWKQYLKVGTLTRQCAYKVEALNEHLNSEIDQTPSEIKSKIQAPCTIICLESGKALKELGGVVRKWTSSSSAISHITFSRTASEDLKSLLKTVYLLEDGDLLDIAPAAAVALQLIGVVKCVEKIAEAVQELASLAHFNSVESSVVAPEEPHFLHQGTVVPVSEGIMHHVITIEQGSDTDLPQNNSQSMINLVVEKHSN
ncbi:hypothetical protein FNV43_RR17745 [Rhamnella rubrinervis]|uniref:Aluminum-activated malate transporter n=1 Tax=Rhamnella rubrinervis TaxID=2594499 RepID=A0A8K0GS75_9ROSA|nr:hypothetical protein FNV43_RR17745 [Rhamnella rubrinervis]